MKKQSIWQILFEFISIVFAVLLALGLNSYKQNQDLKSESEVLTTKILSEVSKNLQKIDTVIAENTDFKIYLDSLQKSKTIDGFNLEFSSKLLSKSAWQFTQASKSFHFMESEFLDEVTELYEMQSFYVDISDQMFHNFGVMLLNMDNTKPKTMVATANYYLTNLLSASQDLREVYKELLSKYDKEKANS